MKITNASWALMIIDLVAAIKCDKRSEKFIAGPFAKGLRLPRIAGEFTDITLKDTSCLKP